MTFPAAVPEIPVSDMTRAIVHYVEVLGFTLDWHDEHSEIAGVSRGDCRLFLTGDSFRHSYNNRPPALFWLNLESRADVDELFQEWLAAHAKVIAMPQDKPWKLREFLVADLDGNLIRVFYDFGTPESDSARYVA